MSSSYSSPESDDPNSQTKTSPTARESEGDDASVFSDDSSKSNFRRSRRNSVESLSKLRRYRASKWRSSVESLGSETDSQAERKFMSWKLVSRSLGVDSLDTSE